MLAKRRNLFYEIFNRNFLLLNVLKTDLLGKKEASNERSAAESGCKILAWIKGLTHKFVFHNDRKAKPTKRGILKKETTNYLKIFLPK